MALRIFALCVVIAAMIGWVMNIWKLFHLTGFDVEFVLRVVAIFVSPIGCVAGYL